MPEVGDSAPSPTRDEAPPSRRARGLAAADFARRALDAFPLTPLGLLLAAGAYEAVRRLAQAQLDLVWLVVGYVGVGLALLCPLFVIAAAVFLRLRGPLNSPTAGAALVLETGTPSDTGFALPLPWYLPLVQLRWQWLEPGPARVLPEGGRGRLNERIELAERGRFERIVRRVVVSDPFGLSRVAFRLRESRSVDVLPRLGGLRHLPVLHALASGDAMPHPMGLEDGDRLELRRYAKGDPARFIHWKVLSRTRKLMVRTPERALSVARRTAAFLVAGPGDDASAAVARLALERRLLGADFTFGGDDAMSGTSDLGEALAIVMRSARSRERGGEGLSAFVQNAERKGPATLLVFAPSHPGPWVDRVTAVARRRKLRVIVGVDGVFERGSRALLWRFLAFPRAERGTAALELEAVLRALGQAGAEVTVLDRGSGKPLGLQQRRAMLALDARIGSPALEGVR